MSNVVTRVEVASSAEVVSARFDEAANDPKTVVEWFTSADAVDASVEAAGAGSWRVAVRGSGFNANADVDVVGRSEHAAVDVDLDIKPRGFFSAAAVFAAVSTGRVEAEIRKTLWREFGQPGEAT